MNISLSVRFDKLSLKNEIDNTIAVIRSYLPTDEATHTQNTHICHDILDVLAGLKLTFTHLPHPEISSDKQQVIVNQERISHSINSGIIDAPNGMTTDEMRQFIIKHLVDA